MASEPTMKQVFIKKLTDILEVNMDNEHFGVRKLADSLGVSRSKLHRKLHEFYGKSASRYIREFRLQKAMVMLQNNVATVSEIAYRVGFASPTYFNTCFHNYYGYPPGEVKFRNPLNKEDEGNIKTAEQAILDNRPLKKQETQNVSFNKRWVALASLGLVIIIFIAYSLYTEPANNKIDEPFTHTENNTVEKSVAVLALKNWSGDPELEFISDGLTDAIISKLMMIKSITKVIPFTSVVKYKTSDKSVPVIAEELGVQHILQGNFQLSGNQMKVTLQLIDGPSNKHTWYYEYFGEWKSNEIFKIQAEVAENVAKNMNVEIKDEEIQTIKKIPTQNKEAYNLWLQANFQALKYTKSGLENAVPLYEKAIDLDSTFINAYTNLAYVYLWGGASWGLYPEQEAWHKAKLLLLKANQLDSTDLQSKCALTDGLYMYEWDFDRMEKEYKTNSNLSILYGLQTGKYEETLDRVNQELQEYPSSSFYYAFKAQALFLLNRKKEALDLLKSVDRLFNDDIMYLRIASRYYLYLGEYESSKVLINRIMTNFSDRSPIILWLSAVHEHIDGDEKGVAKYLSDLNKSYEDGTSGSPAWFKSLYYCAIEDYENAIIWLQRSYDRHEVEMIWLREEPLLIPLRNDTRYLELYAKVGFPMEPHSALNKNTALLP
ncbi:MAG: helix-turn-helix domain-containing protein [Maribacter sp.]